MDNDGWSAAVIAEPVGDGKFRPVLVLSRADGVEVEDLTIPLEGEFDSRLGAEECGKDAIAAMARTFR